MGEPKTFRILHFTDLHVAPPGRIPVLADRWKNLAIKTNQPWLRELLDQLHHLSAPDEDNLRQPSIGYALEDEGAYPVDMTVCTGDLSTLGDLESIERAQAIMRSIAENTGDGALLMIPGNHELFPGADDLAPMSMGEETLRRHRVEVMNKYFPEAVPGHVMYSCPLPEGGQLKVAMLDTLVHEPLANTLGLGEVRPAAYYLEPGDAPAQGRDQLEQLIEAVEQDDVLLVLMHHPPTLPAKVEARLQELMQRASPVSTLELVDRARVVDYLTTHSPCPALVLSGHTHEWHCSRSNAGRGHAIGFVTGDSPSQPFMDDSEAASTRFQLLTLQVGGGSVEVDVQRFVLDGASVVAEHPPTHLVLRGGDG